MQISPNLTADTPGMMRGAEAVACPRCSTQRALQRSASAPIDGCGFESYSFKCRGCGARIAGVVDPADDALLLSVMHD